MSSIFVKTATFLARNAEEMILITYFLVLATLLFFVSFIYFMSCLLEDEALAENAAKDLGRRLGRIAAAWREGWASAKDTQLPNNGNSEQAPQRGSQRACAAKKKGVQIDRENSVLQDGSELMENHWNEGGS